MSNVEKLEAELKEAKERILKIETYFKIGFVVAVIFGLVGSFGASLISDVKKEIASAQESTSKIITEINKAKTKSIEQIAVKEKTTLKELTDIQTEAIQAISKREEIAISTVTNSANGAIQTALTLQVPEVKKWPDGSYCILRGNSSCPVSFSQVDSKLWALSMYDKSPTYATPATFGSSSIGLHNSGRSPNWYGDINLSVCCK